MKMDKYQKAILAIVIITVVSSISHVLFMIFGEVETDFPFIIFFPGFLVIWIPIIAQKRAEVLKKQEESTKRIKE